jgi:hypothetical protein
MAAAAALRPPTTPTSSTTKSRNNGSSSIRRRACAVHNKVRLTYSCHHLLHQQLSGHMGWLEIDPTSPPTQTQGAIIRTHLQIGSRRNRDANMPFKEIPILDMSLARAGLTKPAFLEQLRDALLNVGFLYIKNTGIDQDLYDKVCEEGIRFFDLPDDEKLRIEMKNAQSFLGYSKVRHQPFSRGLL